MKKVYSINTQLYKVTGVEKVMMNIHHAVQNDYDTKIVGTVPYNQVHHDHKISRNEYIKFRNPFMFRNSIVVVHERKLLILFWLLNHLLFQNIKLVYVHHNVFHNKRRLSIMPKNVVAISDEGISNLVDYFNVPIENITKIYNCVEGNSYSTHKGCDNTSIKILCPARINSQKRQVEIVSKLRGKIDGRIKLMFAGTGPKYDQLVEIAKNDKEFEVLGYRSDIVQLMRECDYVLLYSKHEGLPITLIEATMAATPIICSNVGGNAEICKNGENGYVVDKDDWDGLISTINNLTTITVNEYFDMSNNSRSIYEKKFTFEIFKKNYCAFFSNMK